LIKNLQIQISNNNDQNVLFYENIVVECSSDKQVLGYLLCNADNISKYVLCIHVVLFTSVSSLRHIHLNLSSIVLYSLLFNVWKRNPWRLLLLNLCDC